MSQTIIPAHPRSPRLLWDYVSLTKPRVMSLLLITALCAMVVALGQWPSWTLAASTLSGLAFSIGGAHAVNMWYDRDIDRLMSRTRHRAVACGRVPAWHALTLGIVLESLSLVWLAELVNSTAALYSFLGFGFYVGIYTLWLKRRTPQNIVIGGAAGAFPPLVGWSAATGHAGIVPWLMFSIIFLWTPPHFWALALTKQSDYDKAGIPMMPIARGKAITTRQMVIYSILTLIDTWVLGLNDPRLGNVFLIGATALGMWFVWITWRLYLASVATSHARASQTFSTSLSYLSGLYILMVTVSLIHH